VTRGGRPVLPRRGPGARARPKALAARRPERGRQRGTLVRALAGLLASGRRRGRLEGRPGSRAWPGPAAARRIALVAAEDEAPDRLTVVRPRSRSVGLPLIAVRSHPSTTPTTPLSLRALQLAEIGHLARRPLGRSRPENARPRRWSLADSARNLRVGCSTEPARTSTCGHQCAPVPGARPRCARAVVAVLAGVHESSSAPLWGRPHGALDDGRKSPPSGRPLKLLEKWSGPRAGLRRLHPRHAGRTAATSGSGGSRT